MPRTSRAAEVVRSLVMAKEEIVLKEEDTGFGPGYGDKPGLSGTKHWGMEMQHSLQFTYK